MWIIKIMNDFIEIYEKILSPTLCNDIISIYEKIASTEPHMLYAGSNQLPDGKMFREDFSIALEQIDDVAATQVFEGLRHAASLYQEKYDVLKTASYNTMRLKMQKTPIGGGYHKWHCEKMDAQTANRLIVWSIYLNDVEEGGETEFLYQHKRIKAEQGNIVLWPSQYTHLHRGNPPISNEKYILTGWFHLQDIG